MLSLQNNQEQLKHDQVMSLVFLVVLVPLSYAAPFITILFAGVPNQDQSGLNCFEANVLLFGSRELAASALPPCYPGPIRCQLVS